MKVYKVLHKPTGLYFTPSRGSGNFSVNGKIYTQKPIFKWYETVRVVIDTRRKEILSKKEQLLIDYFEIPTKSTVDSFYYHYDHCFKTKPEDWELVELNVTS